MSSGWGCSPRCHGGRSSPRPTGAQTRRHGSGPPRVTEDIQADTDARSAGDEQQYALALARVGGGHTAEPQGEPRAVRPVADSSGTSMLAHSVSGTSWQGDQRNCGDEVCAARLLMIPDCTP